MSFRIYVLIFIYLRKKVNRKEKMVAIAFDLNFQHATEIFSGAADYVRTAGLDWRLLPLNFGFEET